VSAQSILRSARRRAGWSQRELARRAGVPFSTVARVETGAMTPRVDTLERLLRACGERLVAVAARDAGVDRTQIRELLGLTPAQRLARLTTGARNLGPLRGAAARAHRARRLSRP